MLIGAYYSHNYIRQNMRRIKRIAQIAQYDSEDPLLTARMAPLKLNTVPQSLNAEMRKLRDTAAHYGLVSLAANQAGIKRRMFTVLDRKRIEPGKWMGYEKVAPQDYQIVINPEMKGQSEVKLKDFEECPSIPGLRFHIWNPIRQNYQFLSPPDPKDSKDGKKLKPQLMELKGFEARIWDHQVRHLQGFLALQQSFNNMELSVSDSHQDNPAMYELVQVLKQQMRMALPQNLKKMMVKPGKKQQSNMPFKDMESVPDKMPKEVGRNMSKQYQRVKKNIEKEKEKGQGKS